MEKINKTKGWFSENINKTHKFSAIITKEKRGPKSIKLYMKEETLQLISWKYKGSSYKTTINN